jgi:hypothetical protein
MKTNNDLDDTGKIRRRTIIRIIVPKQKLGGHKTGDHSWMRKQL